LQIKTEIVGSQTANSKPLKQEANGTVILPPLVFPGLTFESGSAGTLIRVDKVVADTVVLARPRQALVKIVVAVVPGKSCDSV
jgi:hypothetical protein